MIISLLLVITHFAILSYSSVPRRACLHKIGNPQDAGRFYTADGVEGVRLPVSYPLPIRKQLNVKVTIQFLKTST